MTIDAHTKLCDDRFRELFDLAKSKNERQFLTSFFRFHERFGNIELSYIPEYEFGEVLEFVRTFESIVDSDEVDDKNKTRTMLLIYCHIVEVDLIHTTLFNMLRTVAGDAYSASISFVKKDGSTMKTNSTSKKIELIKSRSAELGIPLESVYSDFYSNDLRNAFSHSRYFISGEAEFNLSDSFQVSKSDSADRKERPHFFNKEQIRSMYTNSIGYLHAFISAYDNFILPYADGNPHHSIFGRIAYNPQHNWYFVKNLE